MALALACTLMFPLHDLAAQPSGLVVTPLEDDSGPERQPARPGMVMDEPGQVITSGTVGGTSEGHAGGAAAGEVGLAPGTDGAALHELLDQPSYKDGIVMAYLVELMRKKH